MSNFKYSDATNLVAFRVLSNGSLESCLVSALPSGSVIDPADPVSTVPYSVTALQGLLAIDQGGLASAYEAWANDPARTFAQKAFIDKAQTWKRNDPTLAAAAASLGLTEAQVDGMFALAATL